MNTKELRDKAYLISTGNFLTEKFDEDKYNDLEEEEIELYCWQPFENMPISEVCSNIESLAFEIINEFKHLVKE